MCTHAICETPAVIVYTTIDSVPTAPRMTARLKPLWMLESFSRRLDTRILRLSQEFRGHIYAYLFKDANKDIHVEKELAPGVTQSWTAFWDHLRFRTRKVSHMSSRKTTSASTLPRTCPDIFTRSPTSSSTTSVAFRRFSPRPLSERNLFRGVESDAWKYTFRHRSYINYHNGIGQGCYKDECETSQYPRVIQKHVRLLNCLLDLPKDTLQISHR